VNRRMTWLGGAALALAAVVVYANSFSGALVFDDIASIRRNPSIEHLDRLATVLNPPATDGMTVGGRPFLNLTLALNYAVSGTETWSYHALNLAIHLLAGLTLFGLLRRTLAGRASPAGRAANYPNDTDWVALAVAMLWTLHPLHTEAVTYVIQRAESLMGLLYLQTLYAFIRTAEKPSSWFWPAWCFTACLLGMATKEVMVSAPVLVLLYDRTFLAGTFQAAWRQRRRLYVSLAGTWLLLGALVASHGGNRGGSIGFGVPIGWWEHALTQFRSVTRYLWLSFWPNPLVFDYGPERIAGTMDVIPYALVVGLLAWVTLLGFWRRNALGFAGLWFFAILAPTSLIPGPTQMTVEHRMYLPLAMVLTVAVVAAWRLGGHRALLAALPVGVVFGGVTIARNSDYRSELSIWEDTALKRPENPVALGSYGVALINANRLPEALAIVAKAVQLNPGYWDNQNNLGIVLEKLNRRPEAAEAYTKSLQARPGRADVRENLARVLLALGRAEEAAAQYREALALQPSSAAAHAGLANALLMLGRAPEAVDHLKTALQLHPDDADAEYNLGNALALATRLTEAVPHFEAALRLRPAFAEAACNLADVLFSLNRPEEAVDRYQAVLQAQPDNGVAHGRFGALLTQLGRRDDAIGHLTQAVRLLPNEGSFRALLGFSLLQSGRYADAAQQYEALLGLNPSPGDAVQAHTLLGTAYRRLNDPAKAANQFREALKIDPSYAPARDGLQGL
jgi:tetratricopeptide (TPR) repeat protein